MEYSSWRTLWFKRKSQVKLLQRLAIVFQINVPDGDAELLKRRKEGWFRRTFINPFKYKRYQVGCCLCSMCDDCCQAQAMRFDWLDVSVSGLE